VATATSSTVDELWTALRQLPPESREEFFGRLVADRALWEELEDLLDLRLADERAGEPVRPLAEVLAEFQR
jgi:hypothetical protein